MSDEFRLITESEDLIRRAIDCEIEDLVRLSWWPPWDLSQHIGTPISSPFCQTAGPAIVFLKDGPVLEIGDADGLSSLTVRQSECRSVDELINSPPTDYADLFAIGARNDDETSSVRNLIGAKIESANLYQPDENDPAFRNALLLGRPCEVGLLFSLSGNNALLFSYNITDCAADFALTAGEGADALVTRRRLSAIRHYGSA